MTYDYIILGEYDKYIHDPVTFFDELSSEGPIHRVKIYSKLPGWLITGYHEAKEVLKDPRFRRDNYGLQNVLSAHGCAFWDLTATVHNMLNSDGVEHTRLRRLAAKPFTNVSLRVQEPWIREKIRTLLHKIPLGETVDIIPAFAYPIPMLIICDLIGVPEGKERDNFMHWADTIFSVSDRQELFPLSLKIYQYVTNLISKRRANPDLENSTNLVDQLITARYENEKLNNEELFATITLLLIAGSETTRNLISSLAIVLGSQPELQEQIRNNRELIPAFIEEVLRNDGPFYTSMLRYVSEDAHVAGVDFAANDIVLISFFAANRDSRVFSHPETLNLDRSHEQPHIGFGYGEHTCIGANLAKLECTIFLEELFNYCDNITLAKSLADLSWRVGNMIRGREEIPIILS